jgi:hypothetical protein
MKRKIVVSLLAIFLLASAHLPEAGQAKFYRVGVILQGGRIMRPSTGCGMDCERWG